MDKRPSWDDTFMAMLPIIEKRVACVHYKIAALLALKGRLVSFGYNGPTRGDVHCMEVGCAKMKDGKMLPSGSGKCRGAHAEINVFLNMIFFGIALKKEEARNAVLYVSKRPCFDCAKHIINTGIKRIIYRDDYDGDQIVFSFLKERKITLIRYTQTKEAKHG